jgi:uncharacterized protein YciI
MRSGWVGLVGSLTLAVLAPAPTGAQAPTGTEAPAKAQAPAEPVFAVTFRTGPGWDAAKPPGEQLHFADHSRNLRQLRADGRILIGGRFGDVGLVLLRAKSGEEARALVERDPSIQAGVFKAEIHPWSPFMGGCTGTEGK